MWTQNGAEPEASLNNVPPSSSRLSGLTAAPFTAAPRTVAFLGSASARYCSLRAFSTYNSKLAVSRCSSDTTNVTRIKSMMVPETSTATCRVNFKVSECSPCAYVYARYTLPLVGEGRISTSKLPASMRVKFTASGLISTALSLRTAM